MPRKRKFIRRKKKLHVSKSVKTYVKRQIKKLPEIKYTNVNVNGEYMCKDNGGALAAYYCITDTIAQGIGDTNQRIGDQIQLRDMDLRFMFSMQAATGTPNPFCRLIIFQYHEYVNTNGQVGSNLELILPATNVLNTGAGGVLGVTSPYDIDRWRSKSFTILYDKMFTLSLNVAGSNNSHNQKCLRVRKKLKSKVYYANESTTNAKNHIFVLGMTNDAYSAVNNPLLFMGSEVTFTDA